MGMFDSPLLHLSAPAVEKALNLALAMDPSAPTKLKPLRGCILEIHISSAHSSIFLGVNDNQIVLLPKSDMPSVRLAGTALAFVKLASYSDRNSLFKAKEICLSGDSVRAQQIRNFVSSINIDWEGVLAEVIGDVPAHFFGTTLRQGLSWSKMLSQSLRRDIEEFIKYEVRLFSSKALAKTQYDAIEQVRLATEQLDARFTKLIKRSESK